MSDIEPRHRSRRWVPRSPLTDPAWWHAALTRAVRTMAQAGIALVPSAMVALSEVPWAMVGSTVVLAGLTSLLVSLGGLPEVDRADVS